MINFAFSLAFISAKIGVTEFPPFLFTTMRFFLIALILIPFLKIHKGQMNNILIVSILGGGIHFAFFYLALDNSQYISSVAIVLQLGVPFATILSVIFLKEVIRWRRILGITLSFGGVIILVFEPTIFSDLGGVYFALLAAFSIAVSLLFMKKLENIKVFDLQAWIAFISFIFLAIVSLIFEDKHVRERDMIFEIEQPSSKEKKWKVAGNPVKFQGFRSFNLMPPVLGEHKKLYATNLDSINSKDPKNSLQLQRKDYQCKVTFLSKNNKVIEFIPARSGAKKI